MRTILSASLLPVFFIILVNDPLIVLGLNKTTSREAATWDDCLSTKKVVGGEHINIKDAPFILRLEMTLLSIVWNFCGAAILSEKVALTAAHCLKYYRLFFINYRIISGSTNEDDGNTHYIKKAVEHENYDGGDYDIALLFVIEPFQFSDSVQPVKLPAKELKVGTLVMAAGYGTVELLGWPPNSAHQSLPIVAHLTRITVPIVDRYTCNATLAKIQKPQKVIKYVTKVMMCAGYPGGKYDSCKGDSGGPLFSNGTIYGVVSWGLGCGYECAPGVYMNVYKFLNWINITIEKNNGK